MNTKLLTTTLVAFFLLSALIIPQIAYCQTTPDGETIEPTPTEQGAQDGTFDLLLIGGIVAAVAVAVAVSVFILSKWRVNEKSLKKASSRKFEEWVINKFGGKPSDPSSGVNAFTEGGQPLLIVQSDHVSLPEVEDFVKILAKGKAQKGTIVAFNYDNDTLEGKITAMDNGIELQMLRVKELLNKRYAGRIRSLASAQATFEASKIDVPEVQMMRAETLEISQSDPQRTAGVAGVKPRVFISNSNTKVADQVKKMLDFLHYDYVVGDKEETTVPIPEGKFGLMKNCDCAVVNIAAAEQERRYSGLYVLNSNVVSEINAAYLKYNTQVILLVERKVELPANLKGLKRIEYDTDDLSFNAAMDLERALADFKRIQ